MIRWYIFAFVMGVLGVGAFMTEGGDEPWNWIFTIPWMIGWFGVTVWFMQKLIADWRMFNQEEGHDRDLHGGRPESR